MVKNDIVNVDFKFDKSDDLSGAQLTLNFNTENLEFESKCGRKCDG